MDLSVVIPAYNEAGRKGARIGEVPITTAEVGKPRGIAWRHGRQLLHVLRYLA